MEKDLNPTMPDNLTAKSCRLTLKQCLQQSKLPRLEAELLMMHILNVSRAYLIAHAGDEVKAQPFIDLCQRRLRGEPIAYLLGKKAFWQHEFIVNSHVLIPRPETELIVETVLQRYAQEETLTLADLGTGSGAIALSLAAEKPNWKVIATDQSRQALQCAQQNQQALQINNIEFKHGSWCAALPACAFDIIVANPPYIDEEDAHLQAGDIRFEPQSALVAAQQGMQDLQTIIAQAQAYLRSNGLLILEHGYNQATAVRRCFQVNGYADIKTLQDLAGLDRITLARKK